VKYLQPRALFNRSVRVQATITSSVSHVYPVIIRADLAIGQTAQAIGQQVVSPLTIVRNVTELRHGSIRHGVARYAAWNTPKFSHDDCSVTAVFFLNTLVSQTSVSHLTSWRAISRVLSLLDVSSSFVQRRYVAPAYLQPAVHHVHENCNEGDGESPDGSKRVLKRVFARHRVRERTGACLSPCKLASADYRDDNWK
jgi:hypothetical protein